MRFEKVERLLEQGEDNREDWLTTTATDAAIPPEELAKTRLLGFRFWHEASVIQGGVMPVKSKDASNPGVRLLVGVFPEGPVAGAKRSEFLKSVSEHVDQARSEITMADLRDAAVGSLGVLALERAFVIVCREDEKGEWSASCHVDQAKAEVLNPREACRALNQRLPLD